MKLLKRSTINSEVALQKKVQIDEGITIAKKVDALRQTLAELERQYSLFIPKMTEELRIKNEKLLEQIDEEEIRIKELEEKRMQLLNPVAYDAWKVLKEKEVEITKNNLNLDEKSLKIAEKEQKTEDLLKKVRETLSTINSRERELANVYRKAEENTQNTEKIKVDMLIQEENQIKAFEKKQNELTEREKSITLYEFTLKDRKEHIEIDEEWIKEEKIRLADQRVTLERAITRIKK